MSADKQHSFRVSPEVKAAFGTYASKFGMTDSELARLLILRERRHNQLRTLVDSGQGITCGSSGDTKVTAHFPTASDRTQFNDYAASCGAGSGRAGAWIIERELQERWFEKALSEPPSISR